MEENEREMKTRVETLETQVAFLVAEVQELRKLQQHKPTKNGGHGSGNSGVGSGGTGAGSKATVSYEQGSPGRRTEPRKVGSNWLQIVCASLTMLTYFLQLLLASPGSHQSSSPEERKVSVAFRVFHNAT